MLKHILLTSLIGLTISLSAQSSDYMFRLQLKDKGTSEFSVDKPNDFLSQKAIDRRVRQKISVDNSDLPISNEYIEEVEQLGCVVVAKSKWLNTLSLHCNDSLLINEIKKLPFVESTKFVWKGVVNQASKRTKELIDQESLSSENNSEIYGHAYNQIALNNGQHLHEAGYRGEGMEIAVIDAGFNGANNESLLLSTIAIKGSKDFVYKGGDMFQSSSHGTKVLSAMGTNATNTFVGTAPKASYWLLRSEDSRSEFPIEEDYWVAAAEYADSIGVDLINSSLGYSKFDKPADSFVYAQMDGKTAHITKGAEIAVSKGIFVVSSAGNERHTVWKYISTPADGEKVFTLGAVKQDSTFTFFSSHGPTADGRIKPDVMAMGEQTALVNEKSEIVRDGGTSFSSPIMCGLIACLWQTNPNLTNLQLADIVREASDRYTKPNSDYGYGLPDMNKAMEIITNQMTSIKPELLQQRQIEIRVDTANGNITIIKKDENNSPCYVYIYTIEGKLVKVDTFCEGSKNYKLNTDGLRRIYLVKVTCNGFSKTEKVCL